MGAHLTHSCDEQARPGSTPAGSVSALRQPPVLTHRLVRGDVARYAGAAGDFHPLHTDENSAREAGFSGVFAHGMLSAGLLATAITDWAGVGTLLRYKVRFVAPAWPGTSYHSEIEVIEKRVEGEQTLVEFECALRDESGEPIVTGSGVVRI